MMNTLLPVFLNLRGRRALVVGGGDAAMQKIRLLLGAGAEVTVIAPHFSAGIESLRERGEVSACRRGYRKGDMRSRSLVVGAADYSAVHQRIYNDARAKGIPVNIVDTPRLCTFYFSSVFQKGDLSIAVSTNGKSPTLGKIIRDAIADEFAGGYPEILETVGDLRSDVLRTLPDFESRKRLYGHIVRTELERRSLGPGKKEKRPVPVRSGEGKVFLVGAGPGDPDLITVKGLRTLRDADVVLHDALLSRGMLALIPPSAEKIDVGKRAGARSTPQQEINDLMIREARSGRRVVRLKAGDPFVFGRGGEELEALRDAGIETEVVPGITAGSGVPASLGIPLTHRSMSSSVVFLTGHEDAAKTGARIDWERIAGIDTVVIYMGIRKLHGIVSRLLRHGVSPERPVAVVFDGTLPRQTVVAGTLEDIEERVAALSCSGPGLIIIGDVVSLLHAGEEKALIPEHCSPL
jgi:uroporphyrin-III C-methyltransferase/precorrin-2 dehydrogenase/sirohydrochlorin ferrochelatase